MFISSTAVYVINVDGYVRGRYGVTVGDSNGTLMTLIVQWEADETGINITCWILLYYLMSYILIKCLVWNVNWKTLMMSPDISSKRRKWKLYHADPKQCVYFINQKMTHLTQEISTDFKRFFVWPVCICFIEVALIYFCKSLIWVINSHAYTPKTLTTLHSSTKKQFNFRP